MNGLELGFRRRCSWCGVVLRLWQLNLCRKCKQCVKYSEGPWCMTASRWDATPDSITAAEPAK